MIIQDHMGKNFGILGSLKDRDCIYISYFHSWRYFIMQDSLFFISSIATSKTLFLLPADNMLSSKWININLKFLNQSQIPKSFSSSFKFLHWSSLLILELYLYKNWIKENLPRCLFQINILLLLSLVHISFRKCWKASKEHFSKLLINFLKDGNW